MLGFKMVKAREIVERLYDGQCTISEYRKIAKPNGATAFSEVVVLQNQPCRLSHNSEPTTMQTSGGAVVTEEIKLFIAPEIEIKPGSKITVTQYDTTAEYQCSGVPRVYQTHQEVLLQIFRGWA